MLVWLIAAACRPGVPLIDTAPKPASPNGTVSGVVRGPEGTSPIVGRVVEVINVDTGERQQETTSSTGGFTFTLKPGQYRVELTLREGESLARRPSVVDLNKSDRDAHADFLRAVVRTSHRFPTGGSTYSGLGPPIA